MREIETDPLLNNKYPFLCQSAAEVGSIQIRNRATVGGNMANATPSADVAPSLIALNATAKIVSGAGARTVPLEEFFRGPGQTVMDPDEILTEITIPKTSPRLVGEYIKFSPRDMMDLAYVGVAVVYTLDEQRETLRKCSDRSRRGGPYPDPSAESRNSPRGPDTYRRDGDESRRRIGKRIKADQRCSLIRRLSARHGRRHDETGDFECSSWSGQIVGGTTGATILKEWSAGVLELWSSGFSEFRSNTPLLQPVIAPM